MDNSGCRIANAACGLADAACGLALADALRRLNQEASHGVSDTGRYRCRYFSWGQGPALVFVPGVAASGRSFVLPIALLAAHFRCIAYDLPMGHGDQARLGRLTHGGLVADLFALLDHLDIAQAYVYGSSFGSTIALAAMHARPQRLPRAVLQGGFAWRPLARTELALARMARYWPGRMRLLPFRVKAMQRVHHGPFADRDPAIWRYFLEASGDVPIATLARHGLLLHQTDLRPILGTIHQPVLMICGDRDPLVRPEHEEILLQGLPNVRRLELDNCGHFPYYTHAELLAALMRQFLTPPAALPISSAAC
jgi:pimeloyl-ACP methyl ester carboxylesterase